MRKLLFIIPLFTFLFVFPKSTYAVNCTFEYDPPKESLNQYLGDLTLKITSPDLNPDDLYHLQVNDPGGHVYNVKDIKFVTGKPVPVIIKHPPTDWPIRTDSQWNLGTYTVFFRKNGTTLDKSLCKDTFVLKNAPIPGACKASIPTKPIDPTTDVTFLMEDLSNNNYKLYINNKFRMDFSNPNNPSQLNLGKFDVGYYTVQVGKEDKIYCNPVVFLVAPMGSGDGGEVKPRGSIPAFCVEKPDDPKCRCITNPIDKGCGLGGGDPCTTTDEKNPGIKTAIGCIHTNPADLTKDLLKFGLSIGGGLSFLMMLFGAFQMMTSAGNPETLNAGRQRLTSAIIGLLFVILSILLLQIIGWDILQLPGFGKTT